MDATKTEADDPDLFVGNQTAIGKEMEFTSYDIGGCGYRPGWCTGGMTTGQTSTIYNGQRVIDMYNPQRHDLLWRGVVSKTLDSKPKLEKRGKKLNKALAKPSKNYPRQS